MQKQTSNLLPEILSGDRSALSKAITLVESQLPEHRQQALNLVDACFAHGKTGQRIGITGVPGVGKSTFIDSFGSHLTGIGKKVAVLAIDPSSQRSRGSILGDKTRMEQLASDPNAFIRPSPTNLDLGGVNRATRQSIILCEAAGFDVIIVETVGVGQSETEVSSMVDFFLLLMLSGAGDDLQGIKRGIMELAHAIFINKADLDEKQARRAQLDYQSALHLLPSTGHNWTSPVLTGSSVTGNNIDAVWDSILEYYDTIGPALTPLRHQQDLNWMMQALHHSLFDELVTPAKRSKIDEISDQVASGETTPFTGLKLCITLLLEP